MTRAIEAWERFWFEPTSTSTLALVRIAVGLVALGWGLSLLPDFGAFFTPDGVFPEQPPEQGDAVWGLLDVFDGGAAAVILYVAFLVAAVALIVGFWSRVAALVVFLALISLHRRAPLVLNSGDGLVRNLAFLLALAPSGAALSVDRWRRERERFWEFPERAPWALRLIQVQVSVLYVSTVWQKVRGVHWNDGTAVSYANRLEDLERLPMPALLTDSVTVVNLLTYGTLAVELALGILIWNRVLRPYVIGLGVWLHAGIDWAIRVGFFSWAIFASYVAFVPPERATAAILTVRDRLRVSPLARRRGPGRPAAAPVARIEGRPPGGASRPETSGRREFPSEASALGDRLGRLAGDPGDPSRSRGRSAGR